ncbi:MAG TPA: hypothetical protein VGO62_22105, partial [Myxococcota bacterium]
RDVRIARVGASVHVSAVFAQDASALAFVAAGPSASVVLGAAACATGMPALVAMGSVSVAFGVLCACGEDGREIARIVRARAARNALLTAARYRLSREQQQQQ